MSIKIMYKLITTFLIIISSSFFYYFKSLQKFEKRHLDSLDEIDSLENQNEIKDSIIIELKDSISPKKEDSGSKQLKVSKESPKNSETKDSKNTQTHSATWYNPHGAKTASGKKFHKDSLYAAYNFCKFNSLVKVTNVNTGESVIVRIIDRMGIRTKNHIDLSKKAFDAIANPKSGRVNVSIEIIE